MVHYYGYNGIKYHVPQLWGITKSNPTTMVEIADLDPMMKLRPWRLDGDQRFGPSELVADPTIDPGHLERVKGADLRYPILVEIDHGMVDGFHRLTKAVLEGKREICARIVTPEQLQYCMMENTYRRCPKYLYYASTKQYTDELPRDCWVTPYRWKAVAMAGRSFEGGRLEESIRIGMVEERDLSYPSIEERRSGAFREFYTKPMYLYTVRGGDRFEVSETRYFADWWSPEPVEIVRTEILRDPLEMLRRVMGEHLVEAV